MVWPVDGSIHTMGVGDVGPVVLAIFKNPDEYIGKKLGLSGERLTMNEYAAISGEVTGKPHAATYISVQQFPIEFPFPGAHDMAAMFEFYNVVNPVRDISLAHSIQTLQPLVNGLRETCKDKFIRK